MIHPAKVTHFTTVAEISGVPAISIPYVSYLAGKERPERRVKLLVPDTIEVHYRRFGEDDRWGAEKVIISGDVGLSIYRDTVCYRNQPHWFPAAPLEDSPGLPDWVREHVLAGLTAHYPNG